EINLRVKNFFRVVIEAHNETGHHLHAMPLDVPDRLNQVAPCVLSFLRLFQTFYIRRLDAYKHAVEPGTLHSQQQLLVIGKIDARFSDKPERVAVSFRPLSQVRQQSPNVFLVTDEIVVHDKDIVAPSDLPQRIPLSQHLCVALGARHATIDLNDVAELAIERATAGVL